MYVLWGSLCVYICIYIYNFNPHIYIFLSLKLKILNFAFLTIRRELTVIDVLLLPSCQSALKHIGLLL